MKIEIVEITYLCSDDELDLLLANGIAYGARMDEDNRKAMQAAIAITRSRPQKRVIPPDEKGPEMENLEMHILLDKFASHLKTIHRKDQPENFIHAIHQFVLDYERSKRQFIFPRMVVSYQLKCPFCEWMETSTDQPKAGKFMCNRCGKESQISNLSVDAGPENG